MVSVSTESALSFDETDVSLSDLVFNLSGEFGEVYVALYLSSCALPGQQVRKVSEVVDDYGC